MNRSQELRWFGRILSPELTEVKIIVFSDLHYGNPYCSVPHFLRTRDFIRDTENCYCFGNGDLCLSPQTKVLKGNLTYVELGDVKVGDELLGVTEHPLPRGRDIIHTKVVSVKDRYADTIKVKLEDETEFIVTPEHPWLAKREHSQPWSGWYWVKTDNLSIGDSLLRVFPVWDTLNNWETGYIAGLLDGEGSICLKNGSNWRARQLAFSQQDGLVLEYFEDYLQRHNISYRKDKTTVRGRAKDTFGIMVRTDAPKLLGMTQPRRLFEKAHDLVEKKLKNTIGVKIVSIQPYKKTEVRTIETDCHTFIAEGIATHNCESTIKASKGDIFKQVGTPQDQRDWVIEQLMPIKDKILGMTTGNHEERIYRETGIDITKDIATALGVPYRPEGMLHKLSFGDYNNRTKGKPFVFWAYLTHGYGGARTKSAKAVKAERASTWIHADYYAMSHDHVVNVAPDIYLMPDNRGTVGKDGFLTGRVTAHREMLIKTNSFIRWGGYAEALGFPPSDLTTPVIHLLTPYSKSWENYPDKASKAVKVVV